MTDRTKIVLAGIAAATVLAVVLAVLLIPKRHVVEIEGGGPLFGESDPAAMDRAADFLREQVTKAETARAERQAAGDADAVAELDRMIADGRKQLAEMEAHKAKRSAE